MDIIWLLVKASWVRVVVAIAAGLISGGCSAGLISIINDAIINDTIINDALINSSPRASITPFIACLLLALCASSVSQFLLIDLAQDSVYTLRMKISQRILAAPLQQLEHLGPSKLLAVLTDDIQAISNTVFIIPNLCINVAVIAGCLVYLQGLSGWLLVAVATFLAVAIALVQRLLAAAYRYLALARQEVDRLFEQFSAVTQGTKELKLNATRRQLFFEKDLQVTAQASRTYIKTAFKIGAMTTNSGQLLFFILIGLLLFGLPSVVPHSQAVLPAYILTITYLLGPIEATIEQLPNLATANVSIQKVNNMGLSLAEAAEIGTAVQRPFQPGWQTLELKHILHTYPGEDRESQFSVGPVSLTFKAGELVFIVGGNGSGKSTLAKIITGLYRPESGELRLDNTPIMDHNREAYRQLFSTVFSDFYLFERLVKPDSYTLDSSTHDSSTPDSPTLKPQTTHYLQKLQLDHKVSIQDGQLSTTALSQGQRKRLALLCAYLEDRSIYLFDEWAADQDPSFRKIFYTQLLFELKARGKTVLVISHDDHYFHLADRIIKLDYGRIESDTRPNKG